MAGLRELLASFSIDTGQAQSALKSIGSAIEGVSGTLGGLAAAFVGSSLVKGMLGFVEAQIEAGDALVDLSAKLGVGTDALQEFQFAAGIFGVSAEGAGTALQFLNKNLGEAIGGGKEAQETFKALGIAVKDGQDNVRDVGELLPELAENFSKLGSDQERTALAMKVFGRSGASLLPLLKEGGDGVKKLQEEFQALGGGMQKDFLEIADRAGDETFRLKTAFSSLKARLAVEVAPTFFKVVNFLKDMTVKAIQLTKETNVVRFAWGLLGSAGAAAAIKAAAEFAKLFGLMPKGNVGILKTLFSLGKIGLIAGGIAFLALIFEDLWTTITGGEGVIEEWLQKTLGVEATNAFFSSLKGIVDQVTQAFTAMGPTLAPIMGDLAKLATEIGPDVAKAFIFVVKVIAAAVSVLTGFVEILAKTGAAVSQVFAGSNAGIDSLGSDLGKIIDRSGDRIFGKGGLFGEAAPAPTAPATIPFRNGPAAGNVQQSNFVEVTVEGGSSPQATGQAVKNGIRGALDGTLDSTLAAMQTGG